MICFARLSSYDTAGASAAYMMLKELAMNVRGSQSFATIPGDKNIRFRDSESGYTMRSSNHVCVKMHLT